ncbi:hypothetical protein [Sphingomonas rubra]|uniref:Transcription antitermination factor NusG n=1 Tax=Sphingomonas rubra TaxID=634430 RepID=A0A1I5UU51_9SPHN|nr:hypothetical protein [Sphingomonas rubra]SFP98730.1 hypothetical protein SAMN04488241_11618 [Sphingomonas rubra]
MGRAVEADDWCILTTASVRTLALAASLRESGMRAWTPVRTERRKGRGKSRNEVVSFDVAITPTFVFVGAEHKAELIQAGYLPVSPYPAFRIMRHRGAIPVIADASLAPLRAAEDRFRRSLLKSTRQRVEAGTTWRMTKGAFAGMTGIVERGGDKDARVSFGSGFVVTIASYLFGTDVVQAGTEPDLGLAA